MHRWYLDDGVFMGSVVEVEEMLAALQQTLSPTAWAWSSICGKQRSGARA